MTRSAFAGFLGYTGSDATNKRRIRAFECGEAQIPLYIARLVWLIGCLRSEVENDPEELWPSMVDGHGNIHWPEWPGYQQGGNDVHEN